MIVVVAVKLVGGIVVVGGDSSGHVSDGENEEANELGKNLGPG